MATANAGGWTDDLLIREIRAGGHRRNKAWEYIYKAWRGYYLKPVLALGGSPEQVDEVMARVVIDVEKQILKPDFQLHSAKLSVFFTECLLRAWSKARKAENKRKLLEFNPDLHLTGQEESVEHEFLKHEINEDLDALLNLLGEKCKKALLMFAEGFSMREIAKELGYEKEQSAKNTKGDCYGKLVDLGKKNLKA